MCTRIFIRWANFRRARNFKLKIGNMKKLKITRGDEGLQVQLVSDKGNEFRGFNIYIYPEEDTVEERVEVIHIDIAVQLEEFLDKEMPVKTGLAEVLRVSRNSVYDLGLILEPVFSFLAELGLDGTCHDVLYARERDHILTIELNSISKVKVYEFWKSLKDEDNGT